MAVPTSEYSSSSSLLELKKSPSFIFELEYSIFFFTKKILFSTPFISKHVAFLFTIMFSCRLLVRFNLIFDSELRVYTTVSTRTLLYGLGLPRVPVG